MLHRENIQQELSNQQKKQKLIKIVKHIADFLKLTIPKNVLDPQLMEKVIKIIVPGWRSSNKKEEIDRWKHIMSFIQKEIIKDQQLGLTNLAKGKIIDEEIYYLYNIISEIIGINQQNSQEEEIQNLKFNENFKKVVSKQQPIKHNQSTKIRPKTAKLQFKNLQAEVIYSVKNALKRKINLKDPKISTLMKQKQSEQAVNKAKRLFNYTIEQHRKQAKNKTKSYPQKKNKSLVDQQFLKTLAKKHKDIRQTITNQQLKYYLNLRQKKIKYIQNIHKLITKLEKQRQIDLHNYQRQIHQKQKQNICNKIKSTENVFNSNLQHLKKQYKERRVINHTKNTNQLNVCKEIQKQIVKKKKQQLDELQVLWKQQFMKINHIIGDNEQKVQKKLLKLYRQNRV